MLTFAQFIIEHVLSIGLNPKHEKYREQHRDEIHDMIHKSYAKAGGYGGHSSGSAEESNAIHHDITHAAHIKATRRNGKITSAMLYKKQHGRKGIGSSTDGTDQGKKDIRQTMHDDHKKKRAWSEVSGAPEHVRRKMGVPVVHNSKASKLTGKEIEHHDSNGEHYTRKIGGQSHKKVIMGYPKD